MVMDNGKDSYFLWENDEAFKQMLMEQNLDDIKFRRQIRLWFRALVGKTCMVAIMRKEQHKVPDG
jgi:very-short-patch-repair endonuclease